MTRKRFWFWILIAISMTAGLTAAPVPAWSEEAGEGETVFQLETITVTAQKQEEDMQEVPQSLTVLDDMTLEDYDIDDLWRMSYFVPNLLLFDTGMSSLFAQPTMRGITAPATTLSSSVGLYVDGVPLLSAPGFQAGLLDVERVEVLRGPQGTLYGKNTEVGAISIITRQPDNELRGKIGLLGGEDQRFRMSGAISGPMVKDRFYYSLSGFYDRKDGFVRNTYLGGKDDDRQKWFGRAQLRWTPMDDIDISLFASRAASDEDGSSMTGSDGFYQMMGIPIPPRGEVSSDLRPTRDTYHDIQSLKIDYDYDENITVTSITARTLTDWHATADFDYTPMVLFHTYQDSTYLRMSQELRFNINFKPFKILAGIYADTNENDVHFGDIPTGKDTTNRDFDGYSYAIFGQADYALTDALHLVAGLRYEFQHLDYKDHLNDIEDEFDAEEFAPKITLKYNFTPEISAYASVAKGYRTGGFNLTSYDPISAKYDSETLWSYEVGVKSMLWDNRVMCNISAYYMDIEDMQVEEWVTPVTSLTTNAAEATSKGVEVEVRASIVDGLSLLGAFGYNDTTFDTFEDALGDYSGNTNPFSPEFTLSYGAQYWHESGLHARADVVNYGKIYMNKENTQKRDSYQVVNAKVGYISDPFEMYLYGQNLFNEKYDSEEYYGFYDVLSEPREIGVEFSYRF